MTWEIAGRYARGVAKRRSAKTAPSNSAKAPVSKLDTAARVYVPDRAAWRAWLAANFAQPEPIWLVYDKADAAARNAARTSALTYDDIVEEALCFGWIDSLPRKLSATQSMLYLSPRKPGSIWSGLNKRRIDALVARGLMMPPGLAKIDAAKTDGSWTAYDAAETLENPPDLAAALERNATARANFAAFAPSARKGILWWIHSAKTDATRAKRVAETVRLAALNLRANFPESRGR